MADKRKKKHPFIIIPYKGYANENRIFLQGRVLENEHIYNGKSNSKIRNLINSFRRFETDEVADAEVRISCNGQSFNCTTDHEGYFRLEEKWSGPDKSVENSWLSVDLQLLSPTDNDGTRITSSGEVLIPSERAEYGVITDIDDTILQTHVSSRLKLKMLYATLFKNAQQRLPMEGTVTLFKAFVRGGDGLRQNPIFYLSHSPWNMYDLLVEFLEVQRFPKGPILLRDYGINPSGAFADHKLKSIDHILETFPHLPFVLLGDSAEKDADFYLDVATRFPQRIKAIYIRHTKNTKNARRIKRLIENNTQVNAILVSSSEEISLHAKELGLLDLD